ncbi:MAG: hypothetical protein QXN55_03595 [Candidatus Nitrosotenuis sp.]|jgi:hypothetical protein
MNKTMLAAIFSVVILMFGAVASAIDLVPDASALKSRGHWLKDVGTWKKDRVPSKVCGDQLCGSINDASIGLRKAQIDRGFSR